MKRLFLFVVCISILVGCKVNEGMDAALALRASVLQASQCTFSAVITADYGDMTYSFAMDCVADEKGNVTFTVTAPQTIAGITGVISTDGGKLTFDDVALAIPLLTDDQITPVSAPWILMRTLRGGYISSCGKDGLIIDDSYADDALRLHITLNDASLPAVAEVYWKTRKILTIEVENFTLS